MDHQKFHYKTIAVADATPELLESLGDRGWELVSTADGKMFFKHPRSIHDNYHHQWLKNEGKHDEKEVPSYADWLRDEEHKRKKAAE